LGGGSTHGVWHTRGGLSTVEKAGGEEEGPKDLLVKRGNLGRSKGNLQRFPTLEKKKGQKMGVLQKKKNSTQGGKKVVTRGTKKKDNYYEEA